MNTGKKGIKTIQKDKISTLCWGKGPIFLDLNLFLVTPGGRVILYRASTQEVASSKPALDNFLKHGLKYFLAYKLVLTSADKG